MHALAAFLRAHSALATKRSIGLVSEVIGGGSWLSGPGDDGAVVPMPDSSGHGSGHVIACGEALLPAFVAGDPFGAGIAAVLANVNDLAAMGAIPLGIVDTVVGTEAVARECLRGMRAASQLYDVPLIGGHLTVHDGAPALSAFGIGHADAVLSATHVAVGQSLIVASCLTGALRTDFPFFRSFDERAAELATDVRLLADVARSGAAVAAKDVSMAGTIGSLAMLLEFSQLGVTVDLAALPRPASVELAPWLTCFPAYSFLLCAPPERAAECLSMFAARGLSAAAVGTIDASGIVRISGAGETADVLDLRDTPITGLSR